MQLRIGRVVVTRWERRWRYRADSIHLWFLAMLEHIDPVVLVAVLRASSTPLFSAWLARASSYEPWVEDTRLHREREAGAQTGASEVRHV